ncbi:MAG: hypothetical protein UY04_C0053G0002 [Parcubacteria group bacterium GW2011_GWA2_47_7]|nr:MAG: hypothetical protein UY04_C0053G0002 [Parcubacteria group bacterium GW2011_GWA2_47_7]
MGAPTCNDVTQNVRVKVDGLGNFAAACSSADGTFTVPGVSFSGDTVMTVYLDTNGGAKAVFVTRSVVADLAGIKLYQNRVIVSHEDIIPMTIAGMNAYDGGDDADIPFIATVGAPSTLTVNPETEFWIWTGKTFIPGGNITLNSGGSGNNWDGSFHVDNNAVFTAQGAESHSVGGKWTLDAGATFIAASSTFTFTATTSGKAITSANGPVTFWNVAINGVGGDMSVNVDTTIGGTLSVLEGTLSGASNVTVNGTNLTGGNGAIAMTGGTFKLPNGGTFGSAVDWSFYDLSFGTGTVATTTKTASSTISIAGVLTILTNHVLDAGTSTTWKLTGAGTPFIKTGTLIASTSVFRYETTAATNVTAADYAQLEFTSSGAGTPTYTFLSGTFTTSRDLVVGDSSHAITVNVTTNDPTLSVSRNVIITSGATLDNQCGKLRVRKSYREQYCRRMDHRYKCDDRKRIFYYRSKQFHAGTRDDA